MASVSYGMHIMFYCFNSNMHKYMQLMSTRLSLSDPCVSDHSDYPTYPLHYWYSYSIIQNSIVVCSLYIFYKVHVLILDTHFSTIKVVPHVCMSQQRSFIYIYIYIYVCVCVCVCVCTCSCSSLLHCISHVRALHVSEHN